jgi:hypothetical protein
MFARAMIDDGSGMPRKARNGDGSQSNYAPATLATDANSVLTVALLAGGLVLRAGMTAARTDTTDTAVNLDKATPGMDVGDTLTFKISNQVAFAETVAGGVGVTASGNLVVAANGYKEFLLQKTGTGASAAFNLIGL